MTRLGLNTTQPSIPEGAVHLIVGDSLVRVLTRIQSHWQTGVFSFSGAATPQMLASLEMLGLAKMYTVTLMMGTNGVSRGESRKVMRLHDKMSCILEELRIQMDPAILTVCTTPYNMKADQHAMEMNEKVRNLNEDNQADTWKECPSRQIVGRSKPDGAILPRGCVLRRNPLRQA